MSFLRTQKKDKCIFRLRFRSKNELINKSLCINLKYCLSRFSCPDMLLFSCSVMSNSWWSPWTVACQASLFFTVFWSWLKTHVSLELMMPRYENSISPWQNCKTGRRCLLLYLAALPCHLLNQVVSQTWSWTGLGRSPLFLSCVLSPRCR